MIKRQNYTLIEILASMSIFIIMMGILFKTFTTSADIASKQSTKVAILSDAGVFFDYITQDLKSMIVNTYPAPESEDSAAGKIDPDSGSTVTDHGDSQLSFTDSSIEFFSNVTPYNETTLVTALGSDPPYVKYHLSSEKIYRTMSSDDSGANALEGMILEGVQDFTIKLWDDYPGGSEVNGSPANTKPACVTISVTLTTPNPNANVELKKNEKRTITKAIFIKR